jgi:putative aldouronate transport system permease protein
MVENKSRERLFNTVLNTGMVLFAFITLLPLLYVLANSFSSSEMVNAGKVGLIPKEFTLVGYKRIFADQDIMRGYLNTLLYTAIGVVLQVTLQFTAAYPLSRRDYRFKKPLNLYFIITMFISGGMIPTYLVVKNLQMINTMWAMIIPGCVGVYNIIVIRTYIQSSIPWEFQEAAMLDGCSNFALFFKIVLPLSRPILAVMVLYALVGYWNSYYNSLLYLTRKDLFPLQRVLDKILVSNEANAGNGGTSIGAAEQALMNKTLKYVTIVVSSAPLLIIYPFFQKFLEKGMMIGGLKG